MTHLPNTTADPRECALSSRRRQSHDVLDVAETWGIDQQGEVGRAIAGVVDRYCEVRSAVAVHVAKRHRAAALPLRNVVELRSKTVVAPIEEHRDRAWSVVRRCEVGRAVAVEVSHHDRVGSDPGAVVVLRLEATVAV